MPDSFNENMKNVLENGNVLTEIEIIRLGMDICSELDLSVKEGVPHASVSEDNIFVGENGIYVLGEGEEISDAKKDIRLLGEVMYVLSGGERGDSQEIFYDKISGLSGELAQILKNTCMPEDGQVYEDFSSMKKDLMRVYAAKYFDGIDVSVSDEITLSSDEKTTLYHDVRQMKKSTQKADALENTDLNNTILADDFGVENEYTFEDALDDAFYEDGEGDDPYRTAIEAGASVTAAAKIMHGQGGRKSGKKRVPNPYDKKKSKTFALVLTLIIMLVLLLAAAIPIIAYVRGISEKNKDGEDTSNLLADTTVVGIEILSEPSRLTYNIGDIVDTNGLVLAVNYESGRVEHVTGGYTVSPSKITESGNQKITLTYGDFSVAYSIDAYTTEIESIIIISLPERMEFELGEEIDFTGLVIDVVYSDGMRESRQSGFSCTPHVADTAGEQNITVSCEGKEAMFTITVNEPEIVVERISLRTKPSKTVYEAGQSLSMSGFSLMAHYSDGSRRIVTSGYTYTPRALENVGQENITVSYGGKTLTFAVTVNKATPVTVTDIGIANMPDKTVYTVGEVFTAEGLVLNVKYSNGTEKTVAEGYTCSPTSFDSIGKQSVTVTYEGKTTTFDVDVTTAVSEIEVVTLPNRISYIVGDTLDTTGLTVLVKYSDGTEKNVESGFNCSPTVLSSAGEIQITLTFSGVSASFDVTVGEPVSTEGVCGSNVKWTLSGSTLKVSGTGQMYDFEEYGAPWSEYNGQISEIVIEDGVLVIGEFAFAHTYAKSVSIGSSVRQIGNGAFYDCKNLSGISVSDSNRFFNDIGGVLFMGGDTLIAYPAGSSATVYTIPRDVTTIGGYRVFYGSNLREIVISKALYSVDLTAFVGAAKLEKFTLGDSKAGLAVKDGVLYTKNFNALICYPAAKGQGTFTLPDGVGVIRENAFANNANLTEIVLPSSLYRIDANAFVGIKKLAEVTYQGDEKAFAKVQINEGNEAITSIEVKFEISE